MCAVRRSRRQSLCAVSDRDVQSRKESVAAAYARADAFVGSLLFDYDDVEWLVPRVQSVKGPRLVFECATELMEFNRGGRL